MNTKINICLAVGIIFLLLFIIYYLSDDSCCHTSWVGFLGLIGLSSFCSIFGDSNTTKIGSGFSRNWPKRGGNPIQNIEINNNQNNNIQKVLSGLEKLQDLFKQDLDNKINNYSQKHYNIIKHNFYSPQMFLIENNIVTKIRPKKIKEDYSNNNEIEEFSQQLQLKLLSNETDFYILDVNEYFNYMKISSDIKKIYQLFDSVCVESDSETIKYYIYQNLQKLLKLNNIGNFVEVIGIFYKYIKDQFSENEIAELLQQIQKDTINSKKYNELINNNIKDYYNTFYNNPNHWLQLAKNIPEINEFTPNIISFNIFSEQNKELKNNIFKGIPKLGYLDTFYNEKYSKNISEKDDIEDAITFNYKFNPQSNIVKYYYKENGGKLYENLNLQIVKDFIYSFDESKIPEHLKSYIKDYRTIPINDDLSKYEETQQMNLQKTKKELVTEQINLENVDKPPDELIQKLNAQLEQIKDNKKNDKENKFIHIINEIEDLYLKENDIIKNQFNKIDDIKEVMNDEQINNYIDNSLNILKKKYKNNLKHIFSSDKLNLLKDKHLSTLLNYLFKQAHIGKKSISSKKNEYEHKLLNLYNSKMKRYGNTNEIIQSFKDMVNKTKTLEEHLILNDNIEKLQNHYTYVRDINEFYNLINQNDDIINILNNGQYNHIIDKIPEYENEKNTYEKHVESIRNSLNDLINYTNQILEINKQLQILKDGISDAEKERQKTLIKERMKKLENKINFLQKVILKTQYAKEFVKNYESYQNDFYIYVHNQIQDLLKQYNKDIHRFLKENYLDNFYNEFLINKIKYDYKLFIYKKEKENYDNLKDKTTELNNEFISIMKKILYNQMNELYENSMNNSSDKTPETLLNELKSKFNNLLDNSFINKHILINKKENVNNIKLTEKSKLEFFIKTFNCSGGESDELGKLVHKLQEITDKELQNCQDELNEKKMTLKTYTSNHNLFMQQKAKIEKERDEFKTRLESLQSDLDSCINNKTSANEAVLNDCKNAKQNLQTKNDELNKQITDIKNKISELEQQIQEKQTELNNFDNKCKEKEKNLINEIEKLKQQQTNIQQEQQTNISNELNQLKQQITKMEGERHALISRIKELKQKSSSEIACKTEKEELENKLKELTNKLNQTEEKLQLKSEDTNTQQQNLIIKIKELEKTLEENNPDKFKEEYNKEKEELENSYQNNLQKLKNELLEKCKNQMTELETKLNQESQEDSKDAQQKLRDAVAKNTMLQNEITTLNNKQKELDQNQNSQIDKLNKLINNLNKQLELEKMAIEDKNQIINKITTTYRDNMRSPFNRVYDENEDIRQEFKQSITDGKIKIDKYKLKEGKEKDIISELESLAKLVTKSNDQSISDIKQNKNQIENYQNKIKELQEQYKVDVIDLTKRNELLESNKQALEQQIKSLELELGQQRDEEMDKLNNEISQLKSIIESLTAEKEQLGMANEETLSILQTQCSEKYNKLQQEYEQLQNELMSKEESMQQNFNRNQTQYEDLLKTYNDLKQTSQLQEESNYQLQEKNNQLNQQISQLNEQLNMLMSDKDTLQGQKQQEINTLQESKQQYEERLNMLNIELTDCQDKLKSLQDKLNQVTEISKLCEEEKQQCEIEKQQLKENTLQLKQENEKLKADITHSIAECTSKLSIVEGTQSEKYRQLQIEKQNLEKQIEQLKNQFSVESKSQLETQTKQSQDIINKLTLEIRDLADEKQNIEKVNTDLKQYIKQLESRIEQFGKEQIEYMRKLKICEQTGENDQQTINNLKMNIEELQQQLEKLNTELSGKINEYNSNIPKLQELQQQLVEKDNELSQVNIQLQECKINSVNNIKHAEIKYNELQNKLKETENELNMCKNTQDELLQIITDKEQKLEQILNNISIINTSLYTHNTELQKLKEIQGSLEKSGGENAPVLLLKNIPEFDISLDELNKPVKSIHKNIKELQLNNIPSLQNQIVDLENNVKETTNNNNKLKQKNEEYQNMINKLKQQLEKENRLNNKNQEKIKNLETQINEKQSSINNNQKDITDNQKIIDILDEKIVNLQNNLKQNKQTKEELDKQISKLNNVISNLEKQLTEQQNEYKKEYDILSKSYNKLSDNSKKIKDELKNKLESITNKYNLCSDKSKEQIVTINTVENGLKEKEKQLEQKNQENIQLQQTLQSKEQEIGNLKKELEKQYAKKSELVDIYGSEPEPEIIIVPEQKSESKSKSVIQLNNNNDKEFKNLMSNLGIAY